ncbi:hypothetical protein, partial [Xanthomonas arboricola]|uniref:hypothetical protein n=1 Tax=Xanthomonas arboricola TaxID=56448 RepID=UPI0028064114
WSEDRFAERIEQTIDMFVREGLLQRMADRTQAEHLVGLPGIACEDAAIVVGDVEQQAFERYYIAISVLVKNGPGVLG